MEQMKLIEVRCPACSERGLIEVSEQKVEEVNRGLLAINVSTGLVCDHSFVVYVDKNMKIRDAFMADFAIELPETPKMKQFEEKTKISPAEIDVVLIKLNLSSSVIVNMLRGIFYGEKIALINNQDHLKDHILNFIEYIMNKSFDSNLSVLKEEDYEVNKKLYKDHLVLKGNEVLRDKKKILNDQDFSLERTIVEKFLSSQEYNSGIILLKNEIQKIYYICEIIVNLIKNFEGKELHSKYIVDKLEKEHNSKVKIPFLNRLYKIIENYFEIEIPISSEVSDFLGFL
jgi:hypothetical protein